ncbi:hypothetical protein PWT90_11014 [Aphanocladium album]|nr:hypothetical protein PWT90_11014 [Aphanocladium album]
MARSSPHAAHAATKSTLVTSFLLLSLLGSTTSAANSQPPAYHDVVAPGVAAPPPPEARNHFNVNQRDQQPTPGPYTPLVTPAPSSLPDDQALRNQGFRQETYYTCMTAPSGREHCGWHAPVLKQDKQGTAAVPGRTTDTGIVVAVLAGFAGVFAIGMM